MFSSLGALVETVSSHVDVTERKRAQEEHERLRQLESGSRAPEPPEHDGRTGGFAGSRNRATDRCARNNARAALNFLDEQPPELGEVRDALDCILDDADRAGASSTGSATTSRKRLRRSIVLISMRRSMR